MSWQENWADDPTRLSVFPSQWFPKWFRCRARLKLRGGREKLRDKNPWIDRVNVLQLLERLTQHLHVMSIIKCTRIIYFQYQHRRHWYSIILAIRTKLFQKGTSHREEWVCDFRNWLKTKKKKVTASVPEAPGSDKSSVLIGLTFNKIWQRNLCKLLNLCLSMMKIRLPIPILPQQYTLKTLRFRKCKEAYIFIINWSAPDSNLFPNAP